MHRAVRHGREEEGRGMPRDELKARKIGSCRESRSMQRGYDALMVADKSMLTGCEVK